MSLIPTLAITKKRKLNLNSLNNILNYKVSYQENTWASLSKDITIQESLELIKSNT